MTDMAEKEINAGGTGNDGQNTKGPVEPKIYESGYFYLSQQINDLRNHMDAKFDRLDAKFESMKKEMDSRFDKVDAKFDMVHKEIKDLSDKIDAKFEAVHKEIKDLSGKTDARFDRIEDKVDNSNKWAIGSVIAVLIGTISVIVTLLLK
ncbi:hypothetical protein TSYNT_5386 [Tepidanaerobacter syntrophicus]|uniref:Uncharacterized protein n=2 Tax=Tepidanaerobacter syntrophicus TaxID=224999 RepID=A0A0U9HEH4_9FIRM|nr:hypothetical protein TSYNT_5386 [Tepidanaerobacter syntrophicus]